MRFLYDTRKKKKLELGINKLNIEDQNQLRAGVKMMLTISLAL